ESPPDLEITEAQPWEQTNYPLTVVVVPGSEIELRLLYDSRPFDHAAIARMAGHFRSLLQAFVDDPRRLLAELAMLTPAERQQLVVEWNDTAGPYPREAAIHELFEAQAARRPEAVAVVLGEEQVSYGELNRRANHLAHHLRACGVGPEVCVGLFVERSLEMVVGILGIIKAGGAYVPLEPSYPAERLAFMLEDVAAPVVLVQESLRERLSFASAGPALRLVRLDGEEVFRGSYPSENLTPGATAETLAYVMYTSGSTGVPKGVSVVHRGVVRLVRGADYAAFGSREVFLQLAPISFDASTLEIWAPLLNGGRLVVFPAGTPSLQDLDRELARRRVTTLWLTAGLFHQMVDEYLPLRGNLPFVPLRGNAAGLASVRQLLAGGDVLSAPHLRRVLAELPDTTVINGYGPTENTTFTCCAPMHRVTEVDDSVSIGRPISGTRVHVLDRELRPVPAGIFGELLIADDGLARGYFDRSALTAEHFIPNPLGPHPGARLYRTGDLVRTLFDGRIEFLGRRDFQVKVRGFRIELGEVEAVLGAHPQVQESAVVVRDDTVGKRPVGKRLTAFVVARVEPAPAVAELRRHLRETLPDYMVPAVFVPLDSLPLTPNGKVDRAALTGRALADRIAPEEDFVPPRTPAEVTLARIWSEVLGVERVGVQDNFFGLGGDSILSIRIVSMAREAGLQLTPRDLFHSPTIAELAAVDTAVPDALVEQETVTSDFPLAGLDQAGLDALLAGAPQVEDLYPLSPLQHGMLFHALFKPESGQYFQQLSFHVEGELDAAGFRRAWQWAVDRHPILRTAFSWEGLDQPLQLVHSAAALPWEEQDWRGLSQEGLEQGLEALFRADQNRGLELTEAPLMRVALIRTGEEARRFLLTYHHLLLDGWSLARLLREVFSFYGAWCRGQAPGLDPPRPYRDYIALLAQRDLAAAETFWRRTLGGFTHPTVLSPERRPEPAHTAPDYRENEITVPVTLSDALQAMAARHGVTVNTLVQGAWALLVARYSDREDVLFGTTTSGRPADLPGVE
ncbi:MAG: amino acid adenylation domain-containing protein, partial [bacterium]|nr:amino acid adenylation domain-containing protein [bacterium]